MAARLANYLSWQEWAKGDRVVESFLLTAHTRNLLIVMAGRLAHWRCYSNPGGFCLLRWLCDKIESTAWKRD